MILDIQTILNGITLRGTDMFFTTTYFPTSITLYNTFQLCVELDEQLIIFDCRDTTINNVSYINSTAFKNALGLQ
jgi:hypothetical protein